MIEAVMTDRIARWLHAGTDDLPGAWEAGARLPDFVAHWRADARALLTLLRDPSDDMVEAAGDYVDRTGRVAVDGVWTAMIDAALGETAPAVIKSDDKLPKTHILCYDLEKRASSDKSAPEIIDRPAPDPTRRPSMTNIEIYRANAAAQRAAALATDLPNRKAMHERSAESWEAMAASAADTMERASVNEAAKAKQNGG
jgi:hypothetical protein